VKTPESVLRYEDHGTYACSYALFVYEKIAGSFALLSSLNYPVTNVLNSGQMLLIDKPIQLPERNEMENQVVCPNCRKPITDNSIVAMP
jgi:hypothetical protein